MGDEIGLGLIGTIPVGGSGGGFLPGTFTQTTRVIPGDAVISDRTPSTMYARRASGDADVSNRAPSTMYVRNVSGDAANVRAIPPTVAVG